MADELVGKGKDHSVGGRDGVKTGTRGERQENAGSEHEEEKSSRQKISPHGSLSRG